jgi:hypothetical protein
MPHPRKEAAAEREREKKSNKKIIESRKIEDAKWADDGDKARKAREERLAARDAKSDEQARREREKADLIRIEEEQNAKIGKQTKLQPPKIKRSDIRVSALSAMTIDTRKSKKKVESDLLHDQPLIPNLNRQASEEEARTGIQTEIATGTAEAVSALTAALGVVKIDAHPEKRMKAAHAAFEERRMKELTQEKPGLKRAQYKEIIFKEWQKSPENPMRPPAI